MNLGETPSPAPNESDLKKERGPTDPSLQAILKYTNQFIPIDRIPHVLVDYTGRSAVVTLWHPTPDITHGVEDRQTVIVGAIGYDDKPYVTFSPLGEGDEQESLETIINFWDRILPQEKRHITFPNKIGRSTLVKGLYLPDNRGYPQYNILTRTYSVPPIVLGVIADNKSYVTLHELEIGDPKGRDAVELLMQHADSIFPPSQRSPYFQAQEEFVDGKALAIRQGYKTHPKWRIRNEFDGPTVLVGIATDMGHIYSPFVPLNPDSVEQLPDVVLRNEQLVYKDRY